MNACVVQALQPNEGEVEELRGHVVIAGFGRVGQIIAQLLSERLIPFVALDVRSDRVQVRKEKTRKYYAFWHQFNEKFIIIRGCPGGSRYCELVS
jgi:phosphoglycerate dehydrogenase-like enzyme